MVSLETLATRHIDLLKNQTRKTIDYKYYQKITYTQYFKIIVLELNF